MEGASSSPVGGGAQGHSWKVKDKSGMLRWKHVWCSQEAAFEAPLPWENCLADSATQVYNNTIPWNITFGLIYFQNNADAASIQARATDNHSGKFGSIFMPRSFNFTAKIRPLIPGMFFLWCQKKVSLFGKNRQKWQKTRIKDEKTKCREAKGLLQVGFQIPGLLARLCRCVITARSWMVLLVRVYFRVVGKCVCVSDLQTIPRSVNQQESACKNSPAPVFHSSHHKQSQSRDFCP